MGHITKNARKIKKFIFLKQREPKLNTHHLQSQISKNLALASFESLWGDLSIIGTFDKTKKTEAKI